MRTWPIAPQGSHRHDVHASVAGVIGAMGSAHFASSALASVNGALHAASWSVYRLWEDRAPVLHLSSSHGVRDTTRDCFAAYLDGLYRGDRTFDAARRQRVMLRLSAGDFPNPEHRAAIYQRHGVTERLSVAEPQGDGSILAVNLYHHEHQGAFDDGEIENFEHLASALLATVRRHIELTAPSSASGAPSRPPEQPRLRAALQQRHPDMPPRELDVCARLLQGMSYDGIAADLCLSVATVKTYRRRAFERMGLHFKSELFAAFVGLA